MAKFFFFDSDILLLLTQNQQKLSGGAAVQSLVWIRGLTELGHTIYIPTYQDEKLTKEETKRNIHLTQIYHKDKGIKKLRVIYYRLPRLFIRLKEMKPDYVYQSIPSWMSFFVAIFCKIFKIKYIQRIANDNDLDRGYIRYHSNLKYLLLLLGMKMSYCVLCQNDYQYNQLQNRFPNKKTLKIHNPFILKEIESPKNSGRKYIAWVAKIRYVKNIKLLYEIALLMPEERFVVAGILSDSDPETVEYLQKSQLLANVTFRGIVNRENILEFLAGAKYLLNTSRYEGFSNTYLEAMAVGTPVLTTPKANPDQIIDKNQIGIVYRTSKELQEKINNLSMAEYKQMSKRCIEYVKNNHDYIRLTKKMLDFIK